MYSRTVQLIILTVIVGMIALAIGVVWNINRTYTRQLKLHDCIGAHQQAGPKAAADASKSSAYCLDS